MASSPPSTSRSAIRCPATSSSRWSARPSAGAPPPRGRGALASRLVPRLALALRQLVEPLPPVADVAGRDPVADTDHDRGQGEEPEAGAAAGDRPRQQRDEPTEREPGAQPALHALARLDVSVEADALGV